MLTLTNVASYFHANAELISTLKFVALFAGAVLLTGFLIRAILGKHSSLNHAISTAMGIFAIYVLTVVVYTFNPSGLSRFLAPLPFVSFSNESLHLFSFAGVQFPALCKEILSMVILAFLVNLIDGIIPNGKKPISWYLCRFIAVVLAMVVHYLVTWIFNAFLPGVLVTYAPMILLGTLIIMLTLGLLKFILGLVLIAVNPLIGALYAFFFSNKIGKSLSKAVFTTLILCVVFYVLSYFGFAVISISASALSSYIPLGITLLMLWYLIGHVL